MNPSSNHIGSTGNASQANVDTLKKRRSNGDPVDLPWTLEHEIAGLLKTFSYLRITNEQLFREQLNNTEPLLAQVAQYALTPVQVCSVKRLVELYAQKLYETKKVEVRSTLNKCRSLLKRSLWLSGCCCGACEGNPTF